MWLTSGCRLGTEEGEDGGWGMGEGGGGGEEEGANETRGRISGKKMAKAGGTN